MGAAREIEQPEAEGGEEEEEEEEEYDEEEDDEEDEEEEPLAGGQGAAMMTSFTDPVVSMDLLRAVLQPTINNEIQAVFGKYMKKAAGNVRENVGEDVDTEQLIHETCRNCLEQAKLLFCDGKKSVARLPHEVPTMKRAKPVEEEVNQHGSPIPKKRKGRPPGQSQLSDPKPVGMNMGKTKSCEPVPRDGPKWDPARIKDSTPLVLGSRANKALGMGGTRGRLYIKHPHMFKYAADPQDKHWLAEQQHMRATGGKMVSAIRLRRRRVWGAGSAGKQLHGCMGDFLSAKVFAGTLFLWDPSSCGPGPVRQAGSSELKLDELKPFIPPPWMTMKVRKYMETLRNEGEQPPPPARPLPLEGAPES
ncbi:hypothetical protein JD844_019403 [Phrynosoma platyrhinos]|uniref:Deoxynucleotidyltransferase terminal-interacting protein 1 n=1 Tax=Phrynosoma platyrhinos TaxID=52577 RepID=A0ABQ7SPZ3_PHRPL|nr:hypothetical protein JD844_019403 [Phrynosoma platyrhinos]